MHLAPLAFVYNWDPTFLGSWSHSITQSIPVDLVILFLSVQTRKEKANPLFCFLSKDPLLPLSDSYQDLPHSSSYLLPSGLESCLYLPQQACYFISATWAPLHAHGTQCSCLPGRDISGLEPVPSICWNLSWSFLIPSAGGDLSLSAIELGLPDIVNKNRQCYIEQEFYSQTLGVRIRGYSLTKILAWQAPKNNDNIVFQVTCAITPHFGFLLHNFLIPVPVIILNNQ